tara:strand:+ start:2649 stop:4241 length:1593 start_codon:yes stop_codon:yes gene_type:complete
MTSEFKAVILPLTFSKSDSDWTHLSHMYSNHPVIDHIIDKQLVFHTSDNEDDFRHTIAGYSCGVLMHVPVDDPAMSRTGVLVVKDGDTWVPIVLHYQQQPFLVECKGVGSGVGRYLSVHSRTQAGTNKTHERVTGAMLKPSMEKEFKNLMIYNSHYNFQVPSILPLACIGFEYSSHDVSLELGLVLRLTPSNVRYSYYQFGSFNTDLFPDRKKVYSVFETINKQLFAVGFRHQNLNSNNLCFLENNEFIVTDFEEMDSIYQTPASLDSETDAVPLYLKVYPFRYIDRGYYSMPALQTFYQNDQAILEIDQKFKNSHAILIEYYDAVMRFVGRQYTQLPLLDWINEYLVPQLDLQKTCLIDYVDRLTEHTTGTFDFDAFIHPYIQSFQLDQATVGLGELKHQTSLATLFLFPHDVPIYQLNERISHIDYVLRQIQSLLHHGDLFLVSRTYQSPFLKMDDITDYWDVHMLLFPFLQFVSHWVYFVTTNYAGFDHQTVSQLLHRFTKDLSDLEPLYKRFKQSSDAFIDYLVSP